MNAIENKNNNSKSGLDSNNSQFLQAKEKDIKTEYFSDRAKRLVTAVYLVTNFIPQNDPLRTKVRQSSVELLSALSGGDTIERNFFDIKRNVSELCNGIVDILEIALFSGYISEMNFSVLKTEFGTFAGEITSFTGGQGTLNRDSLRSEKLLLTENSSADKEVVDYKGHVVEKVSVVETKSTPKAPKSDHDSRKTSRKEAILSIIRKRGAVGIKDISSVIIDCSEKTIQRELTDMVENGVLKRTGERRWSVYSLA